MKRLLLLITAIAIGLVSAVLFNKDKTGLELLADVEPQKFDRLIKPVELIEKNKVDLALRDSVYQIHGLKEKEDKIYLLSTYDHKVHVYDSTYKKINEIGKGRGRGPGELIYLVDFEFSDNGIWLADSDQLALHKFDLSGTFINSLFVKGHPLRITSVKDHVIAMTMGNGTDSLFTSISLSDNRQRNFGNIVNNQVNNFLALTGRFEKLRNGFFYIPKHASLIYRYDENFELIKLIKTPDGQYFPGVESTKLGDGVQYRAPETPAEAYASFVDYDSKRLFVWVYLKKSSDGSGENGLKGFIDVYSIAKNKYLYSYAPDVVARDFVLNKNKRYLCIINVKDQLICYHVVEN